MRRSSTSFRLSQDAKKRLAYLSALYGISQGSILELLLRGNGAEDKITALVDGMRRSSEGAE